MSHDRKLPPSITLKGAAEMEIAKGETYEEPGYLAEDSMGRDLTDKVEIVSPDMSEVGEYQVTYSVVDGAGNSASATRTVSVTPPKQTKEGAERGLAILMYHDVYDAADPPDEVDANMISTRTLKNQLTYLEDQDYYFPTWDEVKAYLEGEMEIPAQSVVLTFDDGTEGFMKYAAPILEEREVHATAFVITSKNGKKMVKKNYKHIDLQSHSHNMHRPGGNIGHGGVFTALSHDEAVKDLKKSQEILGTSNAFAYPFGDLNEDCKKAVKDAGFDMAFTTENGKVHPGDDMMELKRVRINGDIPMDAFRELLR